MRLRGKRIFVVEDNPENRIVYHMIFAREGVIFEFERFGRTALIKLERFMPVDLIILDLMLAAGDSGYDIFNQIRAMPEYNGIPLIAVSSSDPSEAIATTRQMGFSGFIAKPIDHATFVEQLATIMNGEAVWDFGPIV